MQPVIDFRNGRYQGETREQLPHGFGFYLDKSFTLCAGEWLSGILSGEAMIVFRLGGVYCGSIRLGEPYGVSMYEMAEDGVRLYWFSDHRGPERVAAVMPFLGLILDIDNSNPQMAKVQAEYTHTSKDEENLAAVAKILNLGRDDEEKLKNLPRFEHYFESAFSKRTAHIFQSIHRRRGSDSSDLFLGMKAQGLGVAIQRNPLRAENPRKHHRSYLVRQMGYFSKENQLRDIGLRAIDNSMKGYVLEEGIFGNQRSVVSYEQGKRPNKAALNFHNHLKRSLFYRDMILPTDYIFKLRDFVWSFDKNLKKIETERLAQNTIESNGQDIQKLQVNEEVPSNPYDIRERLMVPPDAALQRVRHDTFVNANKSKKASAKFLHDYQRPEYVDPNNNTNTSPRRQSPSNNRYSPVRAYDYPSRPYAAREDRLPSYSPTRKYHRDYEPEEPANNYFYPRTQNIEADPYYPERARRYLSPGYRDYEQPGSREPISPSRRSPRRGDNYFNYLEPQLEREGSYPREKTPYYPPARQYPLQQDYYPADRYNSPGRYASRL